MSCLCGSPYEPDNWPTHLATGYPTYLLMIMAGNPSFLDRAGAGGPLPRKLHKSLYRVVCYR